MKKSLLFSFSAVILLLLCFTISGKGQTIIFSENFSGFSTGSHATPSTSDASANLDSKTQVPGWTGLKVYSAGGEIKLGTSEIIGWIETPEITFSGYEGILKLKFDICRWPNDATSVQVFLNGTQIGNTLSPTDDFQTIEINVTPGVSSGKIKFEALSKRFFLDNILVASFNSPTADNLMNEPGNVEIFPNPAGDFFFVKCGPEYEILDVFDSSGKKYYTKILTGAEITEIFSPDLPAGVYFIRLWSGKKIFTRRLIKLK